MTSVAFLIDQLFSPAPGGIGTYVRELVAAVSRADPSLEIGLFHSRFGREPPELWTRHYRVDELPSPIRVAYAGWAIARRPTLPAGLASTDLLHTPSPVAVPPPGPNQKLVVTVHDVAFLVYPKAFRPRWRAMYRLALARTVRNADAVITVSRHTAEELLRRTRLTPDRVHVTPLAAALPASGGNVDEVIGRLKVTRPYVLFVGTLEPRKNLVRLVRAYRRFAALGAPHSLVLAGPMGWQHQRLLGAVAEDGAGEVVLTGPVNQVDLDALYRGADAFIYPSLYEGFGLPVLEAMARGVPCVVAAAASLPEVAGEAALPVDPRSVDALADALDRITTDRQLANRLRDAGLDRAAKFSWDETARRTLEVYKSVL